jgi:hypothetical protein
MLDPTYVPAVAFGTTLVVGGLYIGLSMLRQQKKQRKDDRDVLDRQRALMRTRVAQERAACIAKLARPDFYIVFDNLTRHRRCSCGAGVLTTAFGLRFQCEKGHDLGKTLVLGDPALEGSGIYLAHIGRPTTGRRSCESCGAPLTSRTCSYCTTENP